MSWETSYRVIGAAEAEQRFSLAGQLTFPYLAPEHQHEIRLYEGDHQVDGDLMVGYERDQPPYHVIVDGNLTIESEFTLVSSDFAPTFVLVRGNLSARVVTLGGAPELIVHGDVTTDDGVLGQSADGPVGRLTVHGQTRGPMVLSLAGFVMDLRHPPDGTAIGEADAFTGNYPVSNAQEMFGPERDVTDDAFLEGLWDDLSSGAPHPLPEVYERWKNSSGPEHSPTADGSTR